MNQCEFMGNLGKNPEIIPSDNGEFATFSVAVNSDYTNAQGAQVTNTEWIPCVCFKPGIVKFIKENIASGNTVFVKGAWQTRTYTQEHVVNTKTNEPHKLSKTELRVSHLHKVAIPKRDEVVNEQA